MLSIVYPTCRCNNHIEWFFETVHTGLAGDYSGAEIIVVDYYADQDGRRDEIMAKTMKGQPVRHVAPKPTAWQGPCKKCKREHFAASNARNTGACYASGEHIMYVDDCSALKDGWLPNVLDAVRNNYVMLGAYNYAKNIRVENGHLVSYDVVHGDSRWGYGSDSGIVRILPGALYGCFVVVPTEAVLMVNGWDEAADGMGFEDCPMGLRLGNAGWTVNYNRNAMIVEKYGQNEGELIFSKSCRPSPPHRDLAWRLLANAERKSAPLDNRINLRELRAHILAGGSFPTDVSPYVWEDGLTNCPEEFQ